MQHTHIDAIKEICAYVYKRSSMNYQNLAKYLPRIRSRYIDIIPMTRTNIWLHTARLSWRDICKHVTLAQGVCELKLVSAEVNGSVNLVMGNESLDRKELLR